MQKKNIMRISKNKDNPYVMINKDAMQDERLSWKARGILGYLLSLPDDWVIYLEELEKHSEKDGRDSLASGIKELMKYGYIVREIVRGEKGKFSAWTYIVYEYPTINGKSDNGSSTNGLSNSGLPNSGLPNSGKPVTTNNTDLTNTDLTKKIKNKKKKRKETRAEIKEKYEGFYL